MSELNDSLQEKFLTDEEFQKAKELFKSKWKRTSFFFLLASAFFLTLAFIELSPIAQFTFLFIVGYLLSEGFKALFDASKFTKNFKDAIAEGDDAAQAHGQLLVLELEDELRRGFNDKE